MKMRIMFATGCCILLAGTIASAASLNVLYQDGTTLGVNNVPSWGTTGNMMDGMSVTVTGHNASGSFTETLYWADNIGVVSSTNGWSLSMSDYNTSTYWENIADAPLWNLENSGTNFIDEVVIDGEPGNTVFDWIYDPKETPGSEYGRKITQAPGDNSALPNLLVTATYRDLVALGGPSTPGTPYGDLYHTLSLTFSDAGNNFFGPGIFSFALDTDNINQSDVPEPATMLLFGIGLAGIAGFKNRQKKN